MFLISYFHHFLQQFFVGKGPFTPLRMQKRNCGTYCDILSEEEDT